MSDKNQKPLIGAYLILLKDNKILLSKPSNPNFKGMYSLVAGHTEIGETIFEAIIREAKDRCAKIVSDILDGKYNKTVSSSNIFTFDELFEFYYENYAKPNKKTYKEDRNLYNKCIKPYIGHKQLSKINKDTILYILNKRRTTKGVFNHTLSLLSKIFNFSIENNIMTENLAKNIKKFPLRSIIRYLSEDEFNSLKNVLNTDQYKGKDIKLFIMIALTTGLRHSNILSIKNNCIDLNKNVIYIEDTKNGESITVNLNENVKKLIIEKQKSYKMPSQYLFNNKNYDGHILSIKKAWLNVKAKANIKDFRIHDLRHTFASYLAKNNVSLAKIQKAMGHKTIAMTLKYAHLSNKDIKDDILNTVECFNI